MDFSLAFLHGAAPLGAARFAGSRPPNVCAGLLAVALTVGLYAGLCGAAPASGPASASGPALAFLLSLRQGSHFPAGMQLAFAPARAASWTVGLEFAGGHEGLQGLWGRRVWRLNPDALAVLGVQAGVNLRRDAVLELPRGTWVGFYFGERWVLSPVLLEFGTALRIPTAQPRQVAWETTASVGFGW